MAARPFTHAGIAESVTLDDTHVRLVVRSVGSADARVISALERVSGKSRRDIAACVYQAPSELIPVIDLEMAKGVVDVLSSTGLQVAIEDCEAQFEGGDDGHEVALVIKEPGQIPSAIQHVAAFLGCSIQQAKQIACASPAVLIGRVSKATAKAIRERFQPLGIEIDVSQAASAAYDVFVYPQSLTVCQSILAAMQQALGRASESAAEVTEGQAVAAFGLSQAEASALTARLGRLGAATRVCNRDFQRFDVRLDFAPDNKDMQEFLEANTDVPAAAVSAAICSAPLIIRQFATHSEMETLLSGVASRGGRATALLLAMQTFFVRLREVGDLGASIRILAGLADITEERGSEILKSGSGTLGPFNKILALWIRDELKRVGTDAEVMTET